MRSKVPSVQNPDIQDVARRSVAPDGSPRRVKHKSWWFDFSFFRGKLTGGVTEITIEPNEKEKADDRS